MPRCEKMALPFPHRTSFELTVMSSFVSFCRSIGSSLGKKFDGCLPMVLWVCICVVCLARTPCLSLCCCVPFPVRLFLPLGIFGFCLCVRSWLACVFCSGFVATFFAGSCTEWLQQRQVYSGECVSCRGLIFLMRLRNGRFGS